MDKHARLITRIGMLTAVVGSLFSVAILQSEDGSINAQLEATTLRGHYRFKEVNTDAKRSVHNPAEWTKRRYNRVPNAQADEQQYKTRQTDRAEDRTVPTPRQWQMRTPDHKWSSTTPRGLVPVTDSSYNERLLKRTQQAREYQHVPQSERELAQTPSQLRRIEYLRERHERRLTGHAAAEEVAGKENLAEHTKSVREAIKRLEANRQKQIADRRSGRRAERTLEIIKERFSKRIEIE